MNNGLTASKYRWKFFNLFCNLLSNFDKDTKDNISKLVVTVSEI